MSPTPWSTAPFRITPVSGVALGIDLVASRLTLIGPYTLTTSKLRLASDGVDLDLRDITGSFGGGRAGAHLEVRHRGELVETEGRLLLDKVDMATLAAPTGDSAPPTGRVSLALDLGGSGRTPLQVVQSLSGQGTIAVQDLEIADADPAALAAVLQETESAATPPDERHTALMFDRALMRGPMKLPTAESTLSAVNGVVRLSPARAQLGNTHLAFSGSLDLSRLLMETAIEYEGPSVSGTSPTGILAWRGMVSAPDRRVTATGLTGVIAMRTIERESRRLEEQRATPATLPTATSPQMPAGNPPAIAPGAPPAAALTPAPVAPKPAMPQPATPKPPVSSPAQQPAARPSTRARDTIERRELPPPATPARPSSFGTSTSTPAPSAPSAATAPPQATRPASSPAASGSSSTSNPAPQATPPAAHHPPKPASSSTAAQPTSHPRPSSPPRQGPRPPASVEPLAQEPTLPPTRGFGDLPRPPGLVGE